MVFFLPTAAGNTPLLAQFRAAFHNQIHFEVARYPQWREFIDAGADFGVLIGAAVNQILATSSDDVCLAGYSFGGFVAWEVATRITVGMVSACQRRLYRPRSLPVAATNRSAVASISCQEIGI